MLVIAYLQVRRINSRLTASTDSSKPCRRSPLPHLLLLPPECPKQARRWWPPQTAAAERSPMQATPMLLPKQAIPVPLPEQATPVLLPKQAPPVLFLEQATPVLLPNQATPVLLGEQATCKQPPCVVVPQQAQVTGVTLLLRQLQGSTSLPLPWIGHRQCRATTQ